MNILCVQETRVEVTKARDIEKELELVYHGVDGKRNGERRVRR